MVDRLLVPPRPTSSRDEVQQPRPSSPPYKGTRTSWDPGRTDRGKINRRTRTRSREVSPVVRTERSHGGLHFATMTRALTIAASGGLVMLGATIGAYAVALAVAAARADRRTEALTEGPDVGDISEGLYPNHVDEAELIARARARHPSGGGDA